MNKSILPILFPLIVAIIGAKTNFISNSDMDDYVSPNGSSSGWFEIDDSEDANYVSIDGQHRLAAIRIITDTKEIGQVEVRPKFEGRQMIMIIQPN